MKGIDTLKDWVGALTELGLMLLALAIVLSLLVGSQMPFFGTVTANIMTWVKDMGSNGLVGLITLGLILWLFSNRKMA
jgi:glucan phosphoethanolaminetransferase (alkaline phosphatase superfamily)